MHPTRGGLLALALLATSTLASASDTPAQAPKEPALVAALERLGASVERLVALIERERRDRTVDAEARRVQLAVSILDLRYRKIDRLEIDISRLAREEADAGEQVAAMRAEVEAMEKEGRAEDGKLHDEVRRQVAQMGRRIDMEDERVRRLADQRLSAENDLASERRRLEELEALVDDWLEKLR